MGTGWAMFRQHHVRVRGLSQIIASLARVSIFEREDALRCLPWTKTERDKSTAQMQTQSTCLVRQESSACAPTL